MFEAMRIKIAAHARRLLPVRAARRFARHQEGATAVEFAMVAAPFLALLFAILETSLVFFAGQTLEAASADSARLIMTGQAQTTNFATGQADGNGFSQADFKNAVCARMVSLFSCDSMYVSVQSYANFGAASTAPPVTNNTLNTANLPYSPGQPGDIVVVQLYYQWPILIPLISNQLANLNGGNRLLVATAVFRNEPYK
jgi:Flp pilus assembly protein TadG